VSLEVRPYSLALQVPYRWSKGTQYSRKGLILRLQDGPLCRLGRGGVEVAPENWSS
jgi:hypothetical protein